MTGQYLKKENTLDKLTITNNYLKQHLAFVSDVWGTKDKLEDMDVSLGKI